MGLPSMDVEDSVMVKSSMNPLLDGCLMFELESGPFVSLFPPSMMRFIAITNNTTEIVHPVTIPFSNLSQDVS